MRYIYLTINSALLAIASCCVGFGYIFGNFLTLLLLIPFILVNAVPMPLNRKIPDTRLRVCADGSDLLIEFLPASVISGAAHIAYIIAQGYSVPWLISALTVFFMLALTFWNGILRVYFTSVQLGIKLRVIGVLCGMVPIANIIALVKIIGVTNREVREETEKIKLNESRKNDKICATKYPVLLVHGVFFRDFKYLNYWGRIPSELEKNGAKIYYGNHQSALSVEDSGRELAARIREIVSETGCEKVNIIAHSKGGLDCRCAITHFGAAPYAATLTTINTPHRGCLFADYLLGKVPEQLKNTIAGSYNLALKRLGDSNPDFIAAVTDLTNENCKLFNERTPDSESVYYQSVGSKLNHATDGKFPLNFSYHIVKHFDGENDGLVSETSFPWGNCYKYLKTDGRRGISHGDMIDLNRENIKDFDVREFYVQLVSDLKNNGY